jgi:LPXTG-site transpeptidase (sortase) family protein
MYKSFKLFTLSFILIASLFSTPQAAYAQQSFPAEINKSFSPISITAGQVSRLSVTIFNPNSFQLTDAAWSDNLIGVQPGIFIANPPNASTTCGGTVTATAGATTLSLSGGTVPPQTGVTPGSCTVSIDISSTTPGNLINTIPTGGLNSTGDLGGGVTVNISNTTPASATLRVGSVQPPSINKNFNPNTVWAGQTSQLTINIVNTDLTTALTQTSITDSLPPNVFLAPNVSPSLTNCGNSAVLTAVSGTSSITLNTAAIPANSTCTIRVNVISSLQGAYTNTIPAGAVKTSQGVTNGSPAASTLNVQQIGIQKAFSPANIPAGGTSTLTITLQNPTAIDYTGVNITDNLPAGLTIVGSPASPQCGGAITSTATSVTLTGGVIPHSLTPPTPIGTCTITVQVTAPANSPTATRTNTIPAGALTTTQGVTNPLPASSNLNVQAALTVLKAFSPATIGAGGVSTVTVTLRNATGTPLTGVNFTDTLPANLTVTGTPASPQCGGTITSTTTAVTLTSGVIPASPAPPAFATCTITFQVTSTVAGPYTNTIPAGDVVTDQLISNVTNTNSNTLNVSAGNVPVTGNKSFNPATIGAGENTRLRINITAPADTNLTNYSITDNLPAGVLITNVNAAGNPTSAVKTANCIGGTLTALTGTNIVSWTGGTVNAGLLCRIDVWVTSNTAGVVTNTINPANITNNEGRTLTNPITSNLTVTNFSMSKAFFPTTVSPNGISTLTITLTNSNSSALVNVSLTDALSTMGGTVPTSGVYIAPTPNASTTCGAGVITFPDTRTISMTGGTIPAQNGLVPGICTINVDVQGRGNATTRTNTIPIANVSGTIDGTATVIRPIANATANLTIANLIIGMVKGFDPLTVFGGSSSTMSVQLVNPNNAEISGISFTDNMPSGMIIANPPNLNTGTCGGSLSGIAGNGSFTFSGGSLPAATSCTLTLSITMTVNGNLTNVIPANAVTTSNGVSNIQPAEASLTNLPGASISKFFSPAVIVVGALSYSTLTITIQNTSSFALTGMGLNDALPGALPSGLEVAGPPAPAPSTTCNGALTATPGTQDIRLSGGTLAGASSCVILVSVTSKVPGDYLNVIPAGALTNDQRATNLAPATDNLVVTTSALAALGDFVWNDLNANGIQDAGETGIDNVTVNLYDGNGGLVSTTTTAGGGAYSFTQLPPGDYIVEFVPPVGYTVSPANQGANDAVDSDANTVTGRTSTITLIAGETNNTIDAGLHQPGTAALGDFVWDDLNANGIQDAGEIGIDNVTVNLYNGNGTLISTTTTAGGGAYSFTQLPPGDYFVEFVPPAGYSVSPANQGGNDATDSDANTVTGRTQTVTLAAGEINNTLDAGLNQPLPASIGDFVWNDINANGIQDAGEIGIGNVTVNLYNGNGTLAASTTTAADGSYLFTQLPPGDYFVEFVPPAGYAVSPANQGADDAVDSDANLITGRTTTTTLVAGENDLTWDAGLYQPANLVSIKKTVGTATASIGENVTYQISINIPPGTYPFATVEDTLDLGLAFVDCDSIDAPGLTTDLPGGLPSACASPTVDDAGGGTPADIDRHVIFNLGTLTNNGNQPVTLTATYRAIVLDIANNLDGVTLGNMAVFTWQEGNTTLPATATVTIIEPKLLIAKTSNIGFISNGTEATITLTITHAADSHSDAFDVDVTDILPTGMDYVANSLDCTLGAQDPDAGKCVFDNITDPTKPTIRAYWTAFTRAGGDGQISFRVVGNSLIPANGNVTNSASAAWTSMLGDRSVPVSFSRPPNPFAIERFYDPADPVNFYGVSSSLTFTPVGGAGAAAADSGNSKKNDGGAGRSRRPNVTVGGFLIPVTGFAPNVQTPLQDSAPAFSSTGLVMEIPALKVIVPITGVQLQHGTWNINWLWDQAGWLDGTAYPTYSGNSVITAHVINSDGKAGPFARLNKLEIGSYIFIYNGDYRYIYQVDSNSRAQPNDISVLEHKDDSWLTLITCDQYDVKTGKYLSRVVVRAKLLDVSLIIK